ncbi:hypothetical protein PV10_07993 [Exophiala mesophila]|uniref:Major facilitator superfamily (MFS) profile domain-containing protein n=1 Tax=Exophiala mesophila TaxID=212818 RepID=A0A0D1Z2Z8_EXOME|nr:uncharacterized protein PV10_07993 [Exophiala mesophila]KIV88299.1 hypothetical protein PV10_07993 [Exophiala mesophila]
MALEKPTMHELDPKVDAIGEDRVSQIDDTEPEEYTHAETRKLVHRIDRRLLSICGLMVAVSLMDRGNVSNAYIAGMGRDLELTVGTRYSIIVLIFFGPYIAFQIPGAVIVKKLGPRWTLPGMTMLWGFLVIGFGFANHWTVLVGLRIILGILEGGLFPGVIYLISLYYTRYDMARRYAFNYLVGLVGASFSGILAYIFIQMDGLGGLEAWRWIFVMEGIVTCVVAGAAFIFLVGYPHNPQAWRFLKREELDYMIRLIERDRQDTEADQKFNLGKFLRPALDLRIWGYGLLYTCSTAPAYAVSYFLPMILNSKIGFAAGVSQILTTPPYIFAAIQMYFQASLSDKYRLRSPVILINVLESVLGLCLLSWVEIPGVQLFAVFLVTAGCNATIPCVLSWQANNIRGHWTRTFCSATLTGMGAVGGILGALTFRSQDFPNYYPGIYTALTCNGVIVLVTLSLVWYLRKHNKLADEGKEVIADLPGFRYTL